jgi:carbon-monoxide dehydrogenase medium subunit
MDIAIAGAGVSIALDSLGRCVAARIAIGAVAPTARRVSAGEELLVGSDLDEATVLEAASHASEASDPIDDKRGSAGYRRRVIAVLVRRAIAIAGKRAGERS